MNESGGGPAGSLASASSVAEGTPKPGKVMSVEVSAAATPQQLTVSWNAVTGASSYKVQWKSGDQMFGDGTESPSRQATSTGRSYTITGLQGIEHTVQVTAINSPGGTDQEGMASAEATGTPKPAAPSDGPTPSSTGGVEELRITWSEVTGAEDYTVQWRLANGQYNSNDKHEITDPSVTEFVIPGLSAGSYRVQVWASNASGDGLPTESSADAVVRDATDNQVTGVRVTAETGERTHGDVEPHRECHGILSGCDNGWDWAVQ